MLCVSAIAVLFTAAALCQGCIHEYGSLHEAKALVGKHFTYGYNGLDWVNDFEACRGSKQSPLLLPSMGAAAKALAPPAAKSTFSYGILENPTITNNGHTLQVVLPASFKSDVQIPYQGDKAKATGTSIVTATGPATGTVKATPAQFHFHVHSEHIMNGVQYPLEMHIVHFIKKDQLPACGDAGCPVVLGIMLELTTDESAVTPELRKIVEVMPLYENQNATIKASINVSNLLPNNMTYFTYEGSLTAPPCTEGILWHVLVTPVKISQSLLTRYLEAVGDTMCDPDDIPKGGVTKGAAAKETEAAKPFFAVPADNADGCHKLANGHNWRAVQPQNGRPVKLAVF